MASAAFIIITDLVYCSDRLGDGPASMMVPSVLRWPMSMSSGPLPLSSDRLFAFLCLASRATPMDALFHLSLAFGVPAPPVGCLAR